MNFCRGAVRRSEYTPGLAVKKKLNFMSASNPMLLDSHLFASVFLGLLFYILRPGKQNAAQLTVLEQSAVSSYCTITRMQCVLLRAGITKRCPLSAKKT